MSKETQKNRPYLSQADVPGYSLDKALRVAEAIANEHGKQPTRPLLVAQAMGVKPGASQFRMLCGTSIAYGLTNGGYHAKVIELTPLGRRIVAPTKEADDEAAKRQASLRPRVPREFLTRYNGSPWPSDRIAQNVLEEMGVPKERTERTLALVRSNARAVGFLRDIKGTTYVDLESDEQEEPVRSLDVGGKDTEDLAASRATPSRTAETPAVQDGATIRQKQGRVFITHGSDRAVVAQLKDLLTFGGFTPVVAIEQESAAKPVPDKVLDDMRSCGAAIIHVGAERQVIDATGVVHSMLNENVLIEIGAALALYDRTFILLVEEGVTLPSNLQGLYEVRYGGGELGYQATMKLLRAFNDFRS